MASANGVLFDPFNGGVVVTRADAAAVVGRALGRPVPLEDAHFAPVAKVLNDFAKGNDKFVIAGGAMPGQVMSPKEIAALAALPSREELLSKLLGDLSTTVESVNKQSLRTTVNELGTAFNGSGRVAHSVITAARTRPASFRR